MTSFSTKTLVFSSLDQFLQLVTDFFIGLIYLHLFISTRRYRCSISISKWDAFDIEGMHLFYKTAFQTLGVTFIKGNRYSNLSTANVQRTCQIIQNYVTNDVQSKSSLQKPVGTGTVLLFSFVHWGFSKDKLITEIPSDMPTPWAHRTGLRTITKLDLR